METLFNKPRAHREPRPTRVLLAGSSTYSVEIVHVLCQVLLEAVVHLLAENVGAYTPSTLQRHAP